jgi:hypothetical protein
MGQADFKYSEYNIERHCWLVLFQIENDPSACGRVVTRKAVGAYFFTQVVT